MKLLDLFCGAGGAAMGYHRAGFTEIVGVDIAPMPRYPFRFVRGDALEYVAAHGHEFDAIHASPPCQRYSEATPVEHRGNHPDMIAPTRAELLATGRPFVIENVEGARSRLINPVMLCGSMFGLPLWRHRYFETHPFWLMSPATCDHSRRPVTFTSGSNSRALNRKMSPVLISGTTPRGAADGGRFEYTVDDCRQAAQIPWMTRVEIDQAIPPAYTEWIGQHLIALITGHVPGDV